MLQHVRRGQEFVPKAADHNAFVDAARAHRDRQHDQRVDPHRGAARTVGVKNTTDMPAPRGGLLWIRTTSEAGYVEVSQPAYPGVSLLLVATVPVPAGRIAAASYSGVVRVLCDEYAGIEAGDRLGPQAESWAAHRFALGPLLVHGLVAEDQQPGGLPEGQGLVWARLVPPMMRA